MNDGPFGAYDEGIGWMRTSQAHHQQHRSVKPESNNFLSTCNIGYVTSSPTSIAGVGGDNYGGYTDLHNFSTHLQQDQSRHQPQQLSPYHMSQQQSHNDHYHSPTSYFGGMMDSQTLDDFESFTRERCHTWPSVQPRPPTSFGNGQQEGTDDDNNQHQFSPPPLPSRGSSGLSLISESNESLLATAAANGGLGTDVTNDWTTSPYSMGGYNSNHGSTVNVNQPRVNQSPPTTTTVSSQSTSTSSGTTTTKRTLQATPSYKSGHPSYVELITQAILSSAEKRMTLSEIYDWMVANVPSFKDQRHLHSSAGWKNSVRHNLSLHARFKRVKRNGMDKPSWWTVDLTEETKRERSKRPRQSRPRANTTTATSREYQVKQQNQQQQRQNNVQGQTTRLSLGFVQPQTPISNDHTSSGHGSMSFSGSLTPASSLGSDIFMLGTTPKATNAAMNSTQFAIPQLQETLMPAPSLQFMGAPVGQFMNSQLDGLMSSDFMDWTQYSSNVPLATAVRSNDQLLDGGTNVTESADLHCLSQAITVSLRDPIQTSVVDCTKSEVALNLTASNGQGANNTSNYFGTSPNNPGNVSTLVNAFRQNTLDDSGKASVRQMLRVQTSGGHGQEMNSPSRSSSTQSPMASCVVQQQQQQFNQGLNMANSLHQQSSPATGLQTRQHLGMSHSPIQRQYCAAPYVQQSGLRKGTSPTSGQLPDDLATLDVGGFDCNIMDVLSYEMNCNSSNHTGFT